MPMPRSAIVSFQVPQAPTPRPGATHIVAHELAKDLHSRTIAGPGSRIECPILVTTQKWKFYTLGWRIEGEHLLPFNALNL